MYAKRVERLEAKFSIENMIANLKTNRFFSFFYSLAVIGSVCIILFRNLRKNGIHDQPFQLADISKKEMITCEENDQKERSALIINKLKKLILTFASFVSESIRWRDVSADEYSSESFKLACSMVSSVKGGLPDKVKLELYGLYKQATSGDCNTMNPGISDIVAIRKWKAWKAVKGISSDRAKVLYFNLAKSACNGSNTKVEETLSIDDEDFKLGIIPSTMRNSTVEDDCDTSDIGEVCQFAARNKLDELRNRLRQDPELLHKSDIDGMTALHFAADRGNIAIVEFLLDAGAKINAQDDMGETPLHNAIVAGRSAIVKLLLERGSDRSILNNDGETPNDLLLNNTNIELSRYGDTNI